MLQCFISLNKVNLFLAFVVLNLLLIHKDLVPEVCEKLLVLVSLDLLESVSVNLPTVDLVNDMREELFVVCLAWVKLDPLTQSLTSSSLNKGRQEWVRHFLPLLFLRSRRVRFDYVPRVRGVLLSHTVLHPVLLQSRFLRGTAARGNGA